ncbi:SDR family oxidoreductase [Amycolatopsis pithecellobii]|uniref:SDR family oxidoreductase n=1 Tax=Amycolatopsis pithecellobii TaxID=664692 RepID=A0A6N7Z3Q7_9PSEU|nr:SDR family oxidoreductase [Amycolatopsis pithecellobii]MTD54744.1 SDR family oxidoreductase [Amycolatopsis pithecellobii]
MRTGTSERPDLPVAVVIGAGGMGMSIARRLGNHYRVLLVDLNAERVAERAAAMRDDGYDARSHQCDITDSASVDRLAETVAETGPCRAVAHVAAMSPSMGSWREILTLNLIGAAYVERALLPRAQPATAAVFVSSVAAHLIGDPGAEAMAVLDDPLAPGFLEALENLVAEHTPAMAYSLAKLALNRMCERRAWAWGQRGARIVSMSPGMIATPMGALEFTGEGRDSKLKLLERTPLGREGTMVETADAIEFLVSSRASFITGTDLLVDGGVRAAIRPSRET